MWSRKPLVVALALLVVVLALLTNKLNTDKLGGHSHEDEAPRKIDKKKIKHYPKLESLNAKVITTPTGLKYQDIKIGSGRSPKKGETVVVRYTGWKTNRVAFDSNDVPGGEPFEFPIGNVMVIKGWDEGILTMKVGGKRRLTVPPKLAYGESGYLPQIEPNATLIFDVEVLAIKSNNK